MIAIDDLRFLAQVVVVVLGWSVVHYLSEVRDRRHSRLELLVRSIDAAWELGDKLLAIAFVYHGNVRNVRHELEIRMMFQDLMLRTISFSELSANIAEIAACRNAVLGLRLSVTRGHFEGRHTAPLEATSLLYWEMSDRAMRVKRAFLKLRHQQYKNR